MRKLFTRITSILGSFILLMSMVPLSVSAADLPAPAHSKTVQSNDDGTYTLTLDVTGREESETVVRPADILVIVDKSGSMDERISSESDGGRPGSGGTSTTRMAKVKALVNHLAEVVLPEGTQNQMSIVSFSGNSVEWAHYDSPWNDATLNLDWTSSRYAVQSSIASLSSNGGTNWEAGFSVGNTQLNNLASNRSDSVKYVIFLSDGDPTFHYREDGLTDGMGDETSDADYDEAVSAALQITGATIYSVGIGGNVSRMQNLADAIGGTYYDGSTSTALDNAFADIESQINKSYKEVVISDTLSAYAEMVNASDIRVSAQDADGNAVDLPEGMTVVYDETTRTVTCTFPKEYVLQANVTYSVRFDIRPTQQAKDEYVAAGQSYPHVGDAGTGVTSENQAGFYSNSTATVSYVSKNGEEYTPLSAEYAKPVIQVPIPPITELPKAGGTGTGWLLALGFGMMTFAATLLIIQKRKQQRENGGGLYD